jgi:hypothetical protein
MPRCRATSRNAQETEVVTLSVGETVLDAREDKGSLLHEAGMAL